MMQLFAPPTDKNTADMHRYTSTTTAKMQTQQQQQLPLIQTQQTSTTITAKPLLTAIVNPPIQTPHPTPVSPDTPESIRA